MVKTLGSLVCLLLLTAGCGVFGTSDSGGETDPAQVDSSALPSLGTCRLLTKEDITSPANATETVDCDQPHTAQTFAVGPLPEEFADAAYDNEELGRYAFGVCSRQFQEFLGADESLVMRTRLSWAWFRPSKKAWADGARWYRCDVIGGQQELTELPATVAGVLSTGSPDDQWMICVDGATVADGEKVPCSQPHTWRAVTTIKLGQPGDSYPGDEVAESRTREYCKDSVGAKLNYPGNFDYGYTWHGKAEWEAGNRRSVCWAKTTD